MTTKITRIKLLSFIPYLEVKDTDLMNVLKRNEVKLDGERTIEPDHYNRRTRRKDGVFGDTVEDIYDFCNDNCTGLWTYTYTSNVESEPDTGYLPGPMSMKSPDIKMTGTLRVFFELRTDRDAFMKNKILMMKLTQNAE